MARLVRAIHVFARTSKKDVDARNKPGHDGGMRHSALMFAVLMTLPHFSVSSATNLAKSAGEPVSAVAPHSVKRCFRLASPSAVLTSLLILVATSAGTPFGPEMPVQKL